MIEKSLEITEVRRDLKRLDDAIAHLNVDDPSNFLDEQHKNDLLESMQNKAADIRSHLDSLLKK